MALPSAGNQISLSMIYKEVTGVYPSAGSNISIESLATGYYGQLNYLSPWHPDANRPHIFGEWFSYDHSYAPAKTNAYIGIWWSYGTNTIQIHLSETETLPITVYGIYENWNGYDEPYQVVVDAGQLYSNIFYDYSGGVRGQPTIYSISIGTPTYWTSPAEGPTHYWYW